MRTAATSTEEKRFKESGQEGGVPADSSCDSGGQREMGMTMLLVGRTKG